MWKPRIELCKCSGDGGEAGVNVLVVSEFKLREAGCKGRERGGVDVVCCYTRVEGVDARQSFRREREVGSDPSLQSGQEERATNIGKEPDCGLRHSKDRSFGSYSYGSVH